jgi:hypothetical protein
MATNDTGTTNAPTQMYRLTSNYSRVEGGKRKWYSKGDTINLTPDRARMLKATPVDTVTVIVKDTNTSTGGPGDNSTIKSKSLVDQEKKTEVVISAGPTTDTSTGDDSGDGEEDEDNTTTNTTSSNVTNTADIRSMSYEDAVSYVNKVGTVEELDTLRSTEMGGKRRRSVLEAIDARKKVLEG